MFLHVRRRIAVVRRGGTDRDIDDLAPAGAHRPHEPPGVRNDQLVDALEPPVGRRLAFGLHLLREYAVTVPGRILHVDDDEGGAGRFDRPIGHEGLHVVVGCGLVGHVGSPMSSSSTGKSAS